MVQRKYGMARRRMTVYLSPELADELRIRAIKEGKEASEIVAEALGKHFKRD